MLLGKPTSTKQTCPEGIDDQEIPTWKSLQAALVAFSWFEHAICNYLIFINIRLSQVDIKLKTLIIMLDWGSGSVVEHLPGIQMLYHCWG